MSVIPTYGLYLALKEQGMELPDDCVDVEIIAPPGDAIFQLRFLCNITPERMRQIAKAFEKLAGDPYLERKK